MANIINITDINDSALDPYIRLTGTQLRNKLEPEKAIFIAESPTVIEVAMNSGCEPVSMLTDERLIKSGSVDNIIAKLPENTPIYTASRELLTNLTGFELTRGSLAAMRRPSLPSVEELCKKHGWKLYLPELSLCGDNAVMVGSQGYYEYLSGNIAGLELNAFAGKSIEE